MVGVWLEGDNGVFVWLRVRFWKDE